MEDIVQFSVTMTIDGYKIIAQDEKTIIRSYEVTDQASLEAALLDELMYLRLRND